MCITPILQIIEKQLVSVINHYFFMIPSGTQVPNIRVFVRSVSQFINGIQILTGFIEYKNHPLLIVLKKNLTLFYDAVFGNT